MKKILTILTVILTFTFASCTATYETPAPRVEVYGHTHWYQSSHNHYNDRRVYHKGNNGNDKHKGNGKENSHKNKNK